MASFTQNITNAVQVFGGPPSQKWGQANYPYTMTWGSSLWGETTSLPYMFYKVISNGLSSDTTISLYIQMRVVLNNAMAISTDMSSGTLRDGSASWKYVFPSNTEDAENVNYASWTAGTNPDVTFTCGAAGSTVWT